MASSDQINTQQLGPYVLLQRLGGGSTGIVYKAQHSESGLIAAVKVLSPSVARNPMALTRFKREFEASRTLIHPCIVRGLEIGQERTLSYLIMDYVEGHSLETRVQLDGKLGEEQAVRMTIQIADALEHAHQRGLIHRDVKPSNILLTPDGDARLTDFGLVKDVATSSALTETASVMGTPNYMAPEQFDDARLVDPRSDLYGLAATLYFAVTGKEPFAARGFLSMAEKKFAGKLVPPRQLTPELSQHVERVITRALSVVPLDRPQSCAEFMRELAGERPLIRRHLSEGAALFSGFFGRMRRWFWPYAREEATRS